MKPFSVSVSQDPYGLNEQLLLQVPLFIWLVVYSGLLLLGFGFSFCWGHAVFLASQPTLLNGPTPQIRHYPLEKIRWQWKIHNLKMFQFSYLTWWFSNVMIIFKGVKGKKISTQGPKCSFGFGEMRGFWPPKTNMEPKNWWFVDVSLFFFQRFTLQ